MRSTQNIKSNLNEKKKSKVGGLILFDFKTHFKTGNQENGSGIKIENLTNGTEHKSKKQTQLDI